PAAPRGGRLHDGRVLEARDPGGRVGVAGVDDHPPDPLEPAAIETQQHRRGLGARAGEPSGASGGRGVRAQDAHIERPIVLDPAGDAGGPEALGQAASELAEAGWRLDPAGAEEAHEIPSPSSSPNIRFRFWTACEDAPFHRLSIAANTIARPVRASR